MRTLLIVTLCLHGLLLAVSLIGGAHPTPAQAGPTPTASENGDVNGDSARDLGDVIYFLNYLFKGGPAPAELECPDVTPPSLPATGQRNCYDEFGAEVLCNDVEVPGQDGFYRAGCGGADRFVDNQDGTVTDTCTGLMWTMTTQDVNGDIQFDFNDMITWKEALKFCEDRDLAGFTDWRLPNRFELESLTELTDKNPGVPNIFSMVPPHLYWTSTTDLAATGNAWFIEFGEGGSFLDSTTKFSRFHVLCVRTAN